MRRIRAFSGLTAGLLLALSATGSPAGATPRATCNTVSGNDDQAKAYGPGDDQVMLHMNPVWVVCSDANGSTTRPDHMKGSWTGVTGHSHSHFISAFFDCRIRNHSNPVDQYAAKVWNYDPVDLAYPITNPGKVYDGRDMSVRCETSVDWGVAQPGPVLLGHQP